MRRTFFAIALLASTALNAVEPDEILDDPIQEQRAREVSKNIRCMVCQNENIDESNAPLARDLRLLIRERVVAGESDRDIYSFIRARYGEFALLKPTYTWKNLALYLSGPLLLLFAGAVLMRYVQRRNRLIGNGEEGLDSKSKERLENLLKEE